MKIIFSEYKTDYSSYTFSYAVYGIKEGQHELPELYSRGFLPYTGDTSLVHDTFYLARSLRVDLQKFQSSSENRRVDRKIEPLAIQMQIFEKKDFDFQDEAFKRFCSDYAEERFSGGSMQAERLAYVLEREMLTHIIAFTSGDKIYGYVFTVMEGDMLHYWFSFYDTEYMRSHSLGKWMMWKVIAWAQQEQLTYVYIGTCYKERSLYKVRDHKGAEFFDGAKWNTDTQLLKDLCKSDEEEKKSDLFKSRPDIYR